MNRLPFFIVLSALLPYLTDIVRVEYLVIPAVLLVAIFIARQVRFDAIWCAAGLVFALGILIVGSMGSPQTGYYTSPFNSFVRLLMPTLMLLSFPIIMAFVDRPLERSVVATVTLSSLTALFTIASIQLPYFGDLIKSWVRSEGEQSVWSASLDIGRYNGIFNQPLEVGTFYSIALLSLVHAWKRASITRWLLVLALILLIIGGSLSLSKNFLVVGIGLAIGLAIWNGTLSITRFLMIIIPTLLVSGYYIIQSNLLYFDSLLDLYSSRGLLSALSAGRYGTYQSEVSWLFSETWNSKYFLFGHGLGAYLPLDSGYLEFFYQGGFLALLGYITFIFATIFLAWKQRGSDEGKLLFALMLYVIIGSLGGPVISAARANVPLMLLISAAIVGLRLYPSGSSKFARHRPNRPLQRIQNTLAERGALNQSPASD